MFCRDMVVKLLRFTVLIISMPAVLLRRLYHRCVHSRDGANFESLLNHEGRGDISKQKWSRQNTDPPLHNVRQLLRPTIFLRHWHPAPEPRKLRSSAWLDGLRGVAALIVSHYHFYEIFFPSVQSGWGSSEADHHLLQFYFIRILSSGNLMVSIFFIISGYVLSQRALQLARTRQNEKLFEVLSSSVCRRWIRLMLPALASVFVSFAVKMCFSDFRQKSSLIQHLWQVCIDMYFLASPVRLSRYASRYNKFLWTIQIEFMGSMLVYLLVLGLGRFRTSVRIAIVSALIFHGMLGLDPEKHTEYLVALFPAGLLLAELDIIFAARKSYLGQTWTDFFRIISYFTLAVGIYLGSHPKVMEASPGYVTLNRILPLHSNLWGYERLYLILGGFIIVGSINFSPILQRPFTSSFAQYLGDISFSLYVLHNCILLNICGPVMLRTVAIFDFMGPEHLVLSYGCGIALGLVFIIPFTFWASDLFTRFVDVKSVKLAKDFELWAIAKPEGEKVALNGMA